MISKISNSQIGSSQWYRSLVLGLKEIGEILANQKQINIPEENVQELGVKIFNVSKELLDAEPDLFADKATKVNEEDRAKFLGIALSLQKISADDFACESIIRTMDRIEELGGDFSIQDAVEISQAVKEKYNK